MIGNDTATMNDQSDQTTSESKEQHEIDNQQNKRVTTEQLVNLLSCTWEEVMQLHKSTPHIIVIVFAPTSFCAM